MNNITRLIFRAFPLVAISMACAVFLIAGNLSARQETEGTSDVQSGQNDEAKVESQDESETEPYVTDETSKKEECLGVCPEQALRSLGTATVPDAPIGANPHSPGSHAVPGAHIGFAAQVYPNVAPAVVLIRTPLGFGTGFIIDAKGWIITNEHVVNHGVEDPKTGGLSVRVHIGKLVDGFMVPREKVFTATVYKSSIQKDLALLKLDEQPDFELPSLKLAGQPSTPGNACLTIGHPTAGLLWTLRTGEVAGVGRWPQDMLQNIITGFTLQGEELKQFQRALSQSPSRKTMISTVGINPGDSGGPLLNTQGEVIAVNFAVPKIDVKQEVSLDKFSYHVHLDELVEFVSEKPEQVPVHVPEVFPVADRSNMYDKDDDGKFESWVFNYLDFDRPSGVLVDLDDSTPGSFASRFASGNAHQSQFDFEYAFQNVPVSRAFFDSDNDGQVDWILTDTDGDERSDIAISRSTDSTGKSQWKLDPSHVSGPMRDYSLFKDKKLGERLKFLFETSAQGRSLAPGTTRSGR